MPSHKPIFLDNHLLVVNKPAGLLSQGDETGDRDLLLHWKGYLKDRFDKPGNVYLGLVHRLDRPASGLMVLARTSKAAARLSRQFKERRVRKEYVALVQGRPDFEGTLTDYLIKEDRRVRRVDAGTPGAKYAELKMDILGTSGRLTLVRIELKTGRPHQIRVQLSSRGTPIVGDFRYGADTELDGKNLALHANRLAFEHPVRSVPLDFRVEPPESWPAVFRRMIPTSAGSAGDTGI